MGASTELIARAQAGDEDAFRWLTDPYRHELRMHCYRLLGSLHDAEDALQETLLAAWQSFGAFEGRSSLRTWLYRIATNQCLNALRTGTRRPRKDPPRPKFAVPAPTRLGEVLWLEPYPDALLERLADSAPGPEAQYETREAISLAFVTALQLLPPRQRAVLILRDVLGFHSKEAAQILESTEEAVASALKRARATVQLRFAAAGEAPAPLRPHSAGEQELVERFVCAFETQDVDGLIALLTADIWLTMPPLPFEYQGPDQARRFLAGVVRFQGSRPRLVATRANGQPAFGLYIRHPRTRSFHAIGLLVLTLAGSRICAITQFDESVVPYFGLPHTLPD